MKNVLTTLLFLMTFAAASAQSSCIVTLFHCPNDTVICNDPLLCSATHTLQPPTVVTSGLCSSFSVMYFLSGATAGGGILPATVTLNVGVTTVSYLLTDASGTVLGQCSYNIVVNDCETPTIVCPPSITVCNDPGKCDARVFWTAFAANDNCTPVMVTESIPNGSSFTVGNHVVTMTATDPSGNTATCTFGVTVNDCELPTIICPSGSPVYTAPAGQCCMFIPSPPPVTVFDNCGATLSCTGGFGCYNINQSFIETCTATDAAGNSVSCTYGFTVLGNPMPEICNGVDDNCNGLIDEGVPPPTQVTGMATTSPGSTRLKLKWNASTCADRYQIRYRPCAATTWTTITVFAPNTQRILYNLACSTCYRWQIRQRCCGLWSAWSPLQTGTTKPCGTPPLISPEAGDTDIADMISESRATTAITPNPNNGNFQIGLRDYPAGDAQITITDLTGRRISRHVATIADESLTQVTIELGQIPSGLYIVTVQSGGIVRTEKLLIE